MSLLPWLNVDTVRNLVECQKYTVDQLMEYLAELYPWESGLSKRNIQRFLSLHDIHRDRVLSDTELDESVSAAAAQVGGTYGRKMMKGFLTSQGVHASEDRIRRSLQRVCPYYHSNRAQGIQNQMNPQVYFAPYFGYNLHLDQNEKLVHYGVVFVLAVDGKSGFIVAGTVMPVKNNLAIYKDIFVPTVTNYGLWDCVNCDHGREFYLLEFIQHYLSPFRVRNGVVSQRPPYKQMRSVQNNRIERIWGEVNPKVGFPIKWALVDMENKGLANSEEPSHLFAMSQVSIEVAHAALQTFIHSWNSHPIPRAQTPASHVQDCQTYAIPPDAIPDCDSAVQLYCLSGGQLTEETHAGNDLLLQYPVLQYQRKQLFMLEMDVLGGPGNIFGLVANQDYTSFHQLINKFIALTEEIAMNNGI